MSSRRSWAISAFRHRQLWVDDGLSPPATMGSSPPIMLTKRAGKIRWNRWSDPLQTLGQVQCKQVVSTDAIRWSSGKHLRRYLGQFDIGVYSLEKAAKQVATVSIESWFNGYGTMHSEKDWWSK